MEPEESAATSLKSESCAEDRIQLVPPGFTGGLESAKDLSPTTPQHGQSSSDDRAAHQITTEASGAGGSNLLNSTMEHAQAYDASTFPISCSLKKHARGFYILSGACCLCGQTFRATGNVYKGKVRRWNHHSTAEKKHHPACLDARRRWLYATPKPRQNAVGLDSVAGRGFHCHAD